VATVLVTGGAGTLGRAVAPLLLEQGFGVRLLDVAPVEVPGADSIEGDVRERRDVERAMAGVHALIHTAAWHGIHLANHSAAEFWSLNVEGTRVVYQAALQAGVRRAVFSSTMGVYGESRRVAPDSPAVRVHEGLRLLPGDVYGLSKVIGEELAAYHHRATGLKGIALRYGMFVPVPFAHYGVRLLYGGVDERDVAAAVVASLRRLERGDTPFGAYNIESALPFTDADGVHMATDPLAAVARYWPDAPELLARLGPGRWNDPDEPGGALTPINEVFEIDRARRDLDWEPRYNFDQFLDGLRRNESAVEDLVPATA
jgi:nucleoside-diphosphate-sugar epimerase